MFFQTTVVAALAALAAATPLAVRTDSKCNTGTVHCCNTVSKESSYEKSKVAGLLALGALKGIAGEIYSDCSPLVTILGASSCSAQTVCCDNNKFNGLVNVGCTPINVAL
ncbi:Hydrophobin [Pleurotus pulmonarius]